MKNVFFAAFFGAACCLSGCRQEAATPATGEHYAFAEEMFRKVWDMYRVPEYGLFSEYYPNSYRPDVNYFDDGAKSTQEVSFLWPMDGVFTSAVALAEVDPVKYGCYVDSMVMAVEQYYDDGRMPAGYQAYPVRMGKVDRYYDDNGLVGLAYVAAYGVTRNPAHLEKAKQVMTFILSGWRPDHDGAVSWLEGVENQKPGCANGKAMLLLSGGIDSPVAGFMVAKRGVKIDAVYFHAPPYTSERAKQKVVDLAKLVARYSGPIYLHVINFTEIQLAIYEKCPHDELTIIMRRYMMKIAEHFAKENKCLGLITGESIGQVASQTMQSLAATNEVCTLPVYRPLIGFDKQEIIEISEKIDTYETSILPFEDCCTIFVAKHPVTKPNLNVIKHSEQKLNDVIDELMKTAIETTEVIRVE